MTQCVGCTLLCPQNRSLNMSFWGIFSKKKVCAGRGWLSGIYTDNWIAEKKSIICITVSQVGQSETHGYCPKGTVYYQRNVFKKFMHYKPFTSNTHENFRLYFIVIHYSAKSNGFPCAAVLKEISGIYWNSHKIISENVCIVWNCRCSCVVVILHSLRIKYKTSFKGVVCKLFILCTSYPPEKFIAFGGTDESMARNQKENITHTYKTMWYFTVNLCVNVFTWNNLKRGFVDWKSPDMLEKSKKMLAGCQFEKELMWYTTGPPADHKHLHIQIGLFYCTLPI